MLCKLLQPPQSIHYCIQSHKFLITQFLQYLILQVNSCHSSDQYTDYIQMTTSGSNVQCCFFLLLKYNIKLFLSTSINQMQVSTICFTVSTSPDSVACRSCAPLSNTWRRKHLLIAATQLYYTSDYHTHHCHI